MEILVPCLRDNIAQLKKPRLKTSQRIFILRKVLFFCHGNEIRIFRLILFIALQERTSTHTFILMAINNWKYYFGIVQFLRTLMFTHVQNLSLINLFFAWKTTFSNFGQFHFLNFQGNMCFFRFWRIELVHKNR